MRHREPKSEIDDTGQILQGASCTIAAAAATLDSDSLRKIPREKLRTKINTPRARANVPQFSNVTLVQHTAEK
jgi:hypothetical protein